MSAYIKELQNRKSSSKGTEKDANRQHSRKRLTARERIDLLVDPGTFTEIDSLVQPQYEEHLTVKSPVMGMARRRPDQGPYSRSDHANPGAEGASSLGQPDVVCTESDEDGK